MNVYELLLNDPIIGKESINFQSSSPLANKLTSLFESVFVYKKSIVYQEDLSEIEKINLKTKKIREFLTKNIHPKIISIVREETGFDIVTILNNENDDIYLNMYVCPEYQDKEIYKMSQQMTVGTLSIDDIRSDTLKNMLDDFKKMSDNLDISTGALIDRNKHPMKYHLGYDELYFFISEDTISPSIVEPPTAAEITAIFLHEIGHMVSMVEITKRMHFINESANIKITELISKKTPSELKEIIDEVATYIESDPDKLNIPNGSYIRSLLYKLSMTLSKMIFTGITMLYPITYISSFLALEVVLSSLLISKCLTYIYISYDSAKYPVMNEFIKNKTSDTRVTGRNTFLIERLADDYVTRLGMGSHLASILFKLSNVDKYLGAYRITGEITKKSIAVANFITNIYYIFHAPAFDMAYTSYEDDVNRVERILQNINNLFKNKSIPTSMRNHYIKEYEYLRRLVNEIKNRRKKERPAYVKWVTKLNPFLLPSNIVNNIGDRKVDKEYTELLNQTDDLMSNNLYYVSHKIRQFIETKYK